MRVQVETIRREPNKVSALLVLILVFQIYKTYIGPISTSVQPRSLSMLWDGILQAPLFLQPHIVMYKQVKS